MATTTIRKTTKASKIHPLTRRPAWKALQNHFKTIRDTHLRTLFEQDPQRGQRMTAEGAGLFLDYSKNRVTDELVPASPTCRGIGAGAAHSGHVQR